MISYLGRIFATFLPLILLLLSSCGPKISNFDLYNQQYFPKSNFMPNAEQLDGKKPKLVVFNFAHNDNKIASQASLEKTLAVEVEAILSNNRLVEIIDRNIAKKLEKEVLLSQLTNSDVSYEGPQVADYAISGIISNAAFDRKYSSGMVLYNKDRGFYRTPPKFNYKAQSSGILKVYEIPSMKVLENVEFAGIAKRSENVRKSGGVSISGVIDIGVQNAQGLDRDDGLVRKSGQNAIDNIASNLKNIFAKKAYILGKKSFNNKSIFKINAGFDDGIKKGDKFDIMGSFEMVNPITNKIEVENRILGSGVVSDKINPKFSWVVLDKKEYNDKIRLGDVVKFKYKTRLSKKIANFIQLFI